VASLLLAAFTLTAALGPRDRAVRRDRIAEERT
jgi:hypothetical protein